jgi:GTP cyclohydrolase II
MLHHLGATKVQLMTNNPRKIKALEDLGIVVVERKSLQADSNPHNVQYLSTKAGKLGHMFEADGE